MTAGHAQILEHVGQSVIVTDLEGIITYANAAAEELYGWGKGELAGRNILDVNVPQISDREAKSIMERVRGGESWSGEFNVKRRDGSVFPAFVTDAPILNHSGGVIGIVGISRDITQRKRNEEQLTASIREVEALRTALDEHAIVSITDPRGTITFVNDKFCTISKYSREELIGQNHRIVNSNYHSKAYMRNLWQTIGRGKVWKGEFRNRARDGSHYWVDATIVPFLNSDGKPYQYVAIRTDVTARKRVEEETRQIAERHTATLESITDAFITTDRSWRLTYLNGRAEDLLRKERAKLLDRVLWSEVPELAGSELQLRLKKSLESNQADRFEFYSEPLKYWLEVRTFPSAQGMAVYFRDVTEQRKTEQQLLRAQRMESLGTLAGGIAHDLNNVFAPLMLGIDLLQADERDSKRLGLYSHMEANLKRGVDMVRQLLTFARGVDGERVEVRVRNILNEVEKTGNDTFLKAIEIRTIAPEEPWSVRGDPTQLHQVLLNLAVNARDAMEHGGILTFSIDNTFIEKGDDRLNGGGTPGRYVAIRVHDTGPGIPPELHERIFEPFFTTKELGKGTGLGLSTSLGIVRSHGGFIRVDSREGNGTGFEIYLPAVPTSTGNHSEPARCKISRGNGKRVLVVDDEATIRKVLGATLESFGYRVTLAASGDEAIELYKRHREDIALVFTDLMMPGMSGAALIRSLRAIEPDVKVIASSGVRCASVNGERADVDVDCFLPKPYGTKVILEAISTVLSGRGFPANLSRPQRG